ncbi:hypothetical protein QBC39DRAFT_421158 [Podospora conica]|nr:hypothetical protein QBC39DRAFT_421158 [Schizothecium conicum]
MPSASLSSFPPELLDKIFRHFCTHCTDDGLVIYHSRTSAQGGASLKNLCRTSRQMSAMATPILHHDLPPLNVNAACQLLTNIIEQPHLADAIHKMKLDPCYWYATRTLGQQRMLNALLERLDLDGWDPYAKERDGSDFDGSDAEDEEDMDDDDDDEEGGDKGNDNETPALDEEAQAADEEAIAGLYNALMRELMTRAKNLREVDCINPMWEETEDGTDRWAPDEHEDAAWLRLAAKPSALANLRHLHISHWDTENGFCLGGDSSEPRIGNLVLAAAGNLERLTLNQCDTFGLETVLPSIKKVELFMCLLTPEDFERFMKCLPGLRDFRYDSGGATVSDEDNEHTAEEVAGLLSARRSTLTSISISYSDSFRQEFEPTLIGSFAEFPVLEELDLWASDLFPVFPLPAPRLVSLLPRSLKRLRIAGSCPARECQALVAAVEAGQFPALEEVGFGRVLGRPAEGQPGFSAGKIKTDEDFWVPLRDSFGKLKIKCSVYE